MRTKYCGVEAYITKDGSEIRELMHPDRHGHGRMSLAEARVAPGTETVLHNHALAEEIYHVVQGRGSMRLGAEEFEIEAGDTVRIQPGVRHGLLNLGDEDLVVLCCCCPPYSHEDTELD